MADDVRELNLAIDLCLRIGEMLLASGAGAADVTATMDTVARSLGLRHVEIDITFTRLAMSYQYDPEEPQVMLMRNVRQRAIDYADLTAVDLLVRDVVAGEVDLWTARNRMATLVSVGKPVNRWVITLSVGVMCAAVAVFLGGTPEVVTSAFVAATLIDRAQLRMTRRRLPMFYVQVGGGAVAALVAVAAESIGFTEDPSTVVTANIIMLLAGIGFMGALQDALTGFYITSGARIIEALLSTAGIIAGVSAGISIGGLVGVDIGRLEPARIGQSDPLTLVIGSAVCAAAFAYSVYAPARALPAVALLSIGAAGIYWGIEEAMFARPWAAAMGAFFVGVAAWGLARRLNVPPLVLVVPPVVPLLPGLSIYRGLSLLSEGGSYVSQGLLAMVTAMSVAIALAAGVILGEYVAQPIGREARKLERRLSGPRLVGPFRARG